MGVAEQQSIQLVNVIGGGIGPTKFEIANMENILPECFCSNIARVTDSSLVGPAAMPSRHVGMVDANGSREAG